MGTMMLTVAYMSCYDCGVSSQQPSSQWSLKANSILAGHLDPFGSSSIYRRFYFKSILVNAPIFIYICAPKLYQWTLLSIIQWQFRRSWGCHSHIQPAKTEELGSSKTYRFILVVSLMRISSFRVLPSASSISSKLACFSTLLRMQATGRFHDL